MKALTKITAQAAAGVARVAAKAGDAAAEGAGLVVDGAAQRGRDAVDAAGRGARWVKDVFVGTAAGRTSAEPFAPPLIAQALERTQIARFYTPGGHGFAAEDANTLLDRLRGRVAEVVGMSNAVHGADRVVDGVLVQSKYHSTAARTVRAAFGDDGRYLYGGQVLEAPRDQYAQCVEIMAERIAESRVPGLTDPARAEDLVRQGTVSYEQAKNVARAPWSLSSSARRSCGPASPLLQP